MPPKYKQCLFKNIQYFQPDFPDLHHLFIVKTDDEDDHCEMSLRFYKKTFKFFYLYDTKDLSLFRMKIPKYERNFFLNFDNLVISQYELQYDEDQKDHNIILSYVEFSSFFPRTIMGKETAKKHGIDIANCECCICADVIKSRQHICITKCNHVFHKKCLKTWLTEKCPKPTCPMCRTDIRK